MPEVVVLVLSACATTLATGIGAVPVFLLGGRAEALTPFLLGFAAGVMGVAAVAGLLIPASEEGSAAVVLSGSAVGVGFLALARRSFDSDAGFMGRTGPGTRTSALVFLVLFVHSLPEGLAIGTAFASDRAGLSLLVILAIAIQNIPEGTSIAIPMAEAGFGRGRQFWAAVATSAPQPVGAVAAYLGGRGGERPAAFLLRFRSRGDAGADRGRDAAEGLRDRRPLQPSAGIASGPRSCWG